MTNVVEITGPLAAAWGPPSAPAPQFLAGSTTDTSVSFRSWLPARELTVVLVDGVDIGEIPGPGHYDYWLDRYVVDVPESSVAKLPTATRLQRELHTGVLTASIPDVTNFSRRRFADEPFSVEELALWNRVIQARRPESVLGAARTDLDWVRIFARYSDQDPFSRSGVVTFQPVGGPARPVAVQGGWMSINLPIGRYVVWETVDGHDLPQFGLDLSPDMAGRKLDLNTYPRRLMLPSGT